MNTALLLARLRLFAVCRALFSEVVNVFVGMIRLIAYVRGSEFLPVDGSAMCLPAQIVLSQ